MWLYTVDDVCDFVPAVIVVVVVTIVMDKISYKTISD